MKPETLAAIQSERDYQNALYPEPKTLEGYILVMEKCMTDLKRAWATGYGSNTALHEIRQVVAVGVAAMDLYGAINRVPSFDAGIESLVRCLRKARIAQHSALEINNVNNNTTT